MWCVDCKSGGGPQSPGPESGLGMVERKGQAHWGTVGVEKEASSAAKVNLP